MSEYRKTTLDEWDKAVEDWGDRERARIAEYAYWGFRLQGFVAGVIVATAVAYLL